MLYPVYVHLGDATHAPGVSIPDFPGCFSAADDFQDLPKNIQEAVEVWCEGQSTDLPEPSRLEDLIDNHDYSGGVWMFCEIDTALLDTKSVRLNITLPQNLLIEIDRHIKKHGATRSGFLAQSARRALS